MCGIAGYYGNGNEIKLRNALKAIEHRGPDDLGLEIFDRVGLGQDRLAIIDLSPAGHQPMFTIERDLVITFNGEIYNYKEIKEQLTHEFKFQSNSDTEVILYAYKKWGKDCLTKLNGMFSFVIYDIKNDLLFGARDRLGEKPLKYYFDGKNFYFASEIKALLSFLENKPGLNYQALYDFLTLMYIPAPHTGFNQIHKLPPAHYFILKNNNLEIKQYWQLDYANKDTHSMGEWQNIILVELERSVKMRMISDVPIGALLSGGVDSSAVVAYMAKNSPKPVKTFSIGFDDSRFDETKFASIVAKQYATEHTVLKLSSEDLISNFDKIIECYDEPLADNSILPTYLVSKLTREHVTVALTGDGGDENFGGYDRYKILLLNDLYEKVPRILRAKIFNPSFISIFTSIKNPIGLYATRFFDSFEAPLTEKYVNYNCTLLEAEKKQILHSDFLSHIFIDTFKTFSESPKFESSIDTALNIDINSYLPEDLLFKTDIAAMASSLELRSPFLDPIFMQKIANMPSNLKVNYFDKKFILKKALVDQGILPREVVYRQKRGFNIPQDKWFKGPLKEYLQDTILNSAMLDLPIFSKNGLEQYLKLYFDTNSIPSKNIFSILILSKWLQKYGF